VNVYLYNIVFKSVAFGYLFKHNGIFQLRQEVITFLIEDTFGEYILHRKEFRLAFISQVCYLGCA
jgi:hypothetical protein